MDKTYKQKKYDYISKYKKQNIRRIALEFRLNEDKELLNHLDSKQSKNAYIKELILNDMQK